MINLHRRIRHLGLSAATLAFTLLSAGAARADDCPQIYWYASATVDPQVMANTTDAYFDSSKPSVVFIHGGGVVTLDDHDLLNTALTVVDVSDGLDGGELPIGWLRDKGYNVGVFYWRSFEAVGYWLNPVRAEELLWSDAAGPDCRLYDDSNREAGHIIRGASLTDHISREYDAVRQCLILFPNRIRTMPCAPVHMVGHSMGAEIGLHMLRRLFETNGTYGFPATFAMLEPAWADQAAHAELTADLAAELIPAVPTHLVMGLAATHPADSHDGTAGLDARATMAANLFDFWIDGENGSSWGASYWVKHPKIVNWWFRQYKDGQHGLLYDDPDAPGYPESIRPQLGPKVSYVWRRVWNWWYRVKVYPWKQRAVQARGDMTMVYDITSDTFELCAGTDGTKPDC